MVVHAELQQLLAKDHLSDIGAVPIDDLRSLRVRCSRAESDVSFVRRVAQGRLDIVGHETQRRAGATAAPPDATGLLFDLPDILADESSGPRRGAAVAVHTPGRIAQDLVESLDRAATPAELSSLSTFDDSRLTLVMDALRDFELELSGERRRLHERIDAIQSEIARRYRDGEASIDSLLN